MKKLMILMLAFAIPAAFAGKTPVCDQIGTESEGWYLDGQLLKDYRGFPALDKCADKAAECAGIGTRSEGWHTFTKTEGQLLAWSKCSDSQVKPVCDGVGTQAEGWYLAGEPLDVIGQSALASCADQHVECGLYSGRIEGWFVYEKTDHKLLAWAKCSN